MSKKPKKENYNCKKCEKGTVVLETKETRNDVLVDVKKCSNCKYQYGLKEFWNAYGRDLNPV